MSFKEHQMSLLLKNRQFSAGASTKSSEWFQVGWTSSPKKYFSNSPYLCKPYANMIRVRSPAALNFDIQNFEWLTKSVQRFWCHIPTPTWAHIWALYSSTCNCEWAVSYTLTLCVNFCDDIQENEKNRTLTRRYLLKVLHLYMSASGD